MAKKITNREAMKAEEEEERSRWGKNHIKTKRQVVIQHKKDSETRGEGYLRSRSIRPFCIGEFPGCEQTDNNSANSNLTSGWKCNIFYPHQKCRYTLVATWNDRVPHSTRTITLISHLYKFRDAGCKVVFYKDYCNIYHQGKLVLHGGRGSHSGMWRLPMNISRTKKK